MTDDVRVQYMVVTVRDDGMTHKYAKQDSNFSTTVSTCGLWTFSLPSAHICTHLSRFITPTNLHPTPTASNLMRIATAQGKGRLSLCKSLLLSKCHIRS